MAKLWFEQKFRIGIVDAPVAPTGAVRHLWICQSLFVSFCLWIGPHWPLADSREAIYSACNLWTSQRRANFMGTESEAGSTLKKRAGEAVSVFKNGWGSVQWLPNTDTHTHTNWPHTHKHCHALMHRLTHAHAHKLWTLGKLPPDMQTFTHRYLTVGQWHGGLRSWIMGMFLSSVIYLAAILR